MKKTAHFLSFVLILGMFFLIEVKAVVAGPHLSFSPASGNYSVGQNFSVTVKMSGIDGLEIGGADGLGTYDSDKLDLVSIEESSSMIFREAEGGGYCIISESSDGKFSFSCNTNSNSLLTNSSGDLVKFNFRAKATGSAKVSFTCVQDATGDTNISTSNPVKDVVVCSENETGSYTIEEGDDSDSDSDSGSDSDSDSDSGSTTSEGSSELPQTGGIGATVGLVIFGAISLVSAVFLKFL